MSRMLTAALCLLLMGCREEAADDKPIDGYREAELTDVSIGTVGRYSARIVIPPGHTREEVAATLEHAAWSIQQRTDAGAVNVFAYRPQDPIRGPFTIGRTVYAPDGDWTQPSSGAPKRFVTDLNELYFNPPKQLRTAGDTVVLADTLLDYVVVSDAFSEWGDAHVVARPKNGSRALIVDGESRAIGAYELVRYRVRLLGRGNEQTGWVFDSDTHSLR